MNPNTKEWTINGVLLAGIVVFLALIGAGQFSGEGDETDPSPTPPATTPSHTPMPFSESTYRPELDTFTQIGALEVIRDLITPSPSPTPIPPSPAPTPSLQRALKNWRYQYFIRSRKIYVFLDKTAPAPNQSVEIKEGESKSVPDPGVRGQEIQVKVKSSGGGKVTLESPDGQTVELSM